MRRLLLGFAFSLLAAVAIAAPSLEIVNGHGGVPLLVDETGDRSLPGILFLHGFGQSYLSFRRQFAATLANRFHLVAFDLRGHGGSGKPPFAAAYTGSRVWADDVEAVIRATRLKRPVVVGWSYGGFVAMDYVRHYGTSGIAGIDLVGSLGGLDGGPSPGKPAASRKPGAAEGGGAAESEAQADTRMSRSLDLAENIVAARRHAAGYAVDTMTEVERTTLLASELMLPAYVRRAMEGRLLDNRDLLPRITVPVLLTHGSGDTTATESACTRIRDALPDAADSVYADTGHLPFIEREQRFDSELESFVSRVNAR